MALNSFPNKPLFLRVFLKHSGKKDNLLIISSFSFSHSVFYPMRIFLYLHEIKNCCLQTFSFWERLKFIIWKRVNFLPNDKGFDWTKLEVYTDKNLNVAQMIEFVSPDPFPFPFPAQHSSHSLLWSSISPHQLK